MLYIFLKISLYTTHHPLMPTEGYLVKVYQYHLPWRDSSLPLPEVYPTWEIMLPPCHKLALAETTR